MSTDHIEMLRRIHRDKDQIDFDTIWSSGLFVFDSNVLLDLYRLPVSAREDLISILKNEDFNKRIWIGFQVILEFINNRFEAISEQKNRFTEVNKIVNDALLAYDNVFKALKDDLSKLSLDKRHSLIKTDKYITDDNIKNGKDFLLKFLHDLENLEKKQNDVHENDNIKDIVFGLFRDKIGPGFNKKQLDDIFKEGETRYKLSIPPGYKDNGKTGVHRFEDKEYIRKYGDLILWKEIIEKAKKDNLKYIVLITGDVKEDWWFEKRGKRLSPRIELLNEIYNEVSNLDTFYMYDTASFLKFAKERIEVSVKDSSIVELKLLIEQNNKKNESKKVLFVEIFRDIFNVLPDIRYSYDNSIEEIYVNFFGLRAVNKTLKTILDIVLIFSLDKSLIILVREKHSNYWILDFKIRKLSKSNDEALEIELARFQRQMLLDGIVIDYIFDEFSFYIGLSLST